MARTARPLKRPAKGPGATRKKKTRKPEPRLDSLGIQVKCNELRCTALTMRRKYCDNAIDILKTKLADKLAEDGVKEIQYLRIETPDHTSELLDFFRSLPIRVDTIGIDTSIDSLEKADWIDRALCFQHLDTLKMSLSEMKVEKTETARKVIDRCLTMRYGFVELLAENRQFSDPVPYIDSKLITDEYLLRIARTMRQDFELNVSATLVTTDGVLALIDAIGKRSGAARLRFQIDNNAREMKAEMLELWGVKTEIDREFKETDQPRTNPHVFGKFVMYNEGCERVCVYDGRVVVKFPTEFLLDGRWHNKNNMPHRITIERVIDEKAQLGLGRGFFEVKHN